MNIFSSNHYQFSIFSKASCDKFEIKFRIQIISQEINQLVPNH